MPYIKVVQVSGGANECGATYQPAVIDGRIDAPKNVDRPIWEWICWWQRSRQNKADQSINPLPSLTIAKFRNILQIKNFGNQSKILSIAGHFELPPPPNYKVCFAFCTFFLIPRIDTTSLLNTFSELRISDL